MSIRQKLLWSYAAMLVIPLVLIVFTSALLVVVYRGDVRSIQGEYANKTLPFGDRAAERLAKEIKRNAEANPALMADAAYLDELSQDIAASGSGLAVRKDDRLVYVSAALKPLPLGDRLPPFERAGHKEQRSAVPLGGKTYSIVQIDFLHADGRPGTAFVVNKISPLVNFARKFFPSLFWSVIVIFVLTHAALTYVVSKSIIGPLQLLKTAVNRIKAGDLDFRVGVQGRDEIGQLGVAFEEMRRQLQESISTQLQYEENRKELITSISHDLKTPLTAIRGYVDGIQDGVADTPEKVNKYIKTISLKAEQMDRLIDELFLYSKLDLKRLPFHFELVSAKAFLRDWTDELQFDLDKKGIRFEPHIDLSPGTQISADRDKLKRVFSNIVDNCQKYMDKPDKTIGLRAFESGASVVVEISDNGRGIDPAALPHIFERFYRAEPSRSKATGGSGLGLAIARQIVEGHGGGICAESVKGEGTRIVVSLPVKFG